uniref:Uncharacterized protein n=1 Tax=Trichogramma kaykai TaxID=54128 RepID=A0ABD2WYM6_9HYME
MVFLLKEPQIGKFGIRYKGPFEIKEVDHNLKNVILLCNGSEKRVHIDKIERADSINPLDSIENNSGAQLEEIIEG